jgi:fatty acid synthase
MVTEDERRWPPGLYDLPRRNGKLKHIDKFDAAFFNVHAKQADAMDPQLRGLLEVVHEAIIDSGTNPKELRGRKIGVFTGAAFSEAEQAWTNDTEKVNGYELTGCCYSMFANRISYNFDFKGPSYSVDTACSSSMVALNQAVLSIRNGLCEAAVVCGVNVLCKPQRSLQFHRLNMLSVQGSCKSFDASGNGYVRSEAIVSVLIQKRKDTFRPYAQILHIKSNSDGFKDEGITFPAGDVQKQLLLETYEEAKIDPNNVFYVEAHGTGTKIGDPQELNSITQVFCSNRNGPLYIGSVKSNMGHSEAASGLCSVAKVVVAMNNGKIPGNLHFKSPNEDIPGLLDGRLRVVDKSMDFPGGIIGISSFGFGGANSHIILSSPTFASTQSVPRPLPLILNFSGRTQESLEVLKDVEESLYPAIHRVFRSNIAGHNFRGYAILEDQERKVTVNEIKSSEKEIWFVFSGMGSQWSGMAKQLLPIPLFRKTIEELNGCIDLDLFHLLEKEDNFDDVVNSFVSIAAIQVALIDLLTALKIVPDKIIGHSVGELACGYADGSVDKFQTVKCAYARGKAIKDAKLAPGAMAAVGLSVSECKKRCPADIFPACHNAEDSVTVSGPVDSIMKFVDDLKYEGIFAKMVNSSNNAFHSKYIQDAAPFLRKYLQEIVTKENPRTEKWVSTSIPESAWKTSLAKTNSVRYMVNNLISPVLFHEGLSKVPENSVIIEVAPHSILNAVIKRSVTNCDIFGLVNRNKVDLLDSLGKIFNAGVAVDFSALYTHEGPFKGPFLSPHIVWDHSHSWNVAKFDKITENYYDIDPEKEDYLKGHFIDGRVLYPATGYLFLVWKTLAKMKNLKYEEMNVTFENVEFVRATILSNNTSKMLVNIFAGSGDFEVFEGGQVVCKGNVQSSASFHKLAEVKSQIVSKMSKDDFYKELRLRGYEYFGQFQGVLNCDVSGERANLCWAENWITFLDTMLQFSILSNGSRGLYLPTRIQKVVLDPVVFKKFVVNNTQVEAEGVPVTNHKNVRILKGPGIEIRNLKTSLAPRRVDHQDSVLEKVAFTNYFDGESITGVNALRNCVNIVLENCNTLNLKVVEVVANLSASVAQQIQSVIVSEPLIQATVTVITKEDGAEEQVEGITKIVKESLENNEKDVHLLVGHDAENLKVDCLKEGGFVILISNKSLNVPGFVNVALKKSADLHFNLFRKESKNNDRVIIEVDAKYKWLEELKEKVDSGATIFLKATPPTGLPGLVNALIKENRKVRMIYSDTSISQAQLEQIYKADLIQNVFVNNCHGCYRHIQYKAAVAETKHAFVNTLQVGDLTSLSWIQSQPFSTKVHYAPLNFRDIMLATGKLPPDALPGNLALQECILGLEFSGVSPEGKNVMGLVSSKGLALSVDPDPNFLWQVPSGMSLLEASTIPVAYSTAYYALVVRGNIRQGETVLIHGGAGGVGMAAIAIAKSLHCRIFTTVGSPDKKKVLTEMFGLGEDNFANSRDASFEVDIIERTEGRGVDLVLNSLADDLLFSSVRCLKENGRFLEIGKYDLSKDSKLGMSLFLKNVAFHGILLDSLFDENGDKIRVRDLVQEGLASGVVKPLPHVQFPMESVEEAFRFMASAKHIGKVVLQLGEGVTAVPRTYFHPQKPYIIFGGLGGLGLELANFIIERGGRKLVLCGRSGVTNGYQQFCIDRWTRKGIDVNVRSVDICCQSTVKTVLNEFGNFIGGIFNLTMVLDDNLIENLSKESFEKVVRPKAEGTKILDELTRSLHVDHFVVFSSVSCGRGNAGQSNYALANSQMERICEERRKKNLPGLAIQFGAIGDVGVVQDQMCGNETIISGTIPQRIISCIKALDLFLADKSLTVVSSMVLAEKGTRKETKGSLIGSIARILGFKDVTGINFDSNLGELGMDSLMGVEVKGLLERDADLSLSVADIRVMTFNDFQKLVA